MIKKYLKFKNGKKDLRFKFIPLSNKGFIQMKGGFKMELTERQNELINTYKNGNISVFKEDLNKLSKKELINFIYNVQEQSLFSANEILSICYKYLK